jgi:hypothetical protein
MKAEASDFGCEFQGKMKPTAKFYVRIVGPIDGARYIKRRLMHYIVTYLRNNWDLKHKVDTGGRISLNASGIEVSGDHARSAYDIVSTPPSVFTCLSKFFPERRGDYSYLDIGSGKGMTVLLASEMGFKACIGVEFASFPCETARKNLQHYIGSGSPRSPCLIVNACATEFRFPDGNVVLFFNNPFAPEIWRKMVPRLVDIANQARDVTIILTGSFPDTISGAADELVQSGIFVRRTEGVTPRFWDSYAPFHFFVLDKKSRLTSS